MKDTASFLLKVFVLSAGLSLLIKIGGPALSTQSLNQRQLNHLAIAIILTPSLTLGAVLGLKLFLKRTA